MDRPPLPEQGAPARAPSRGRGRRMKLDPPPEAPAAEAAPHWTGHRDRLRQRFLEGGAGAVQDYELLELILFGAIPRRDVKPLAKALIASFGSLGGVMAATPAQLAASGPLSSTAVSLIKAVQAAAELMLREGVAERPVLTSWDRLLDYLGVAMTYETREQLRLLFLDKKNKLLADEVQHRGTVDHTPLYPREVVRRAIELNASALIVAHNHPSGDPTPSRADIATTRELARALETVGIILHDHVIVGRGRSVSFRATGLL